MARVIKKTRTMKPVTAPKKTARTAASVRSGAKRAAVAKPGAKPRSTAAAAPKLTVTEMRTQLEKLTKANATLRAKNRDVLKSSKTSAATIAALEERVAALESELAALGSPTKPDPQPRRARRPKAVHPIDRHPAEPPSALEEAPEAEPSHADMESEHTDAA